jgi:hypothetical protein
MPLAPITIIRSRRDEFRKKKYANTKKSTISDYNEIIEQHVFEKAKNIKINERIYNVLFKNLEKICLK